MTVAADRYGKIVHEITHDVITNAAMLLAGDGPLIDGAALVHVVAGGSLGVGLEIGVRLAIIDPAKAEALREHWLEEQRRASADGSDDQGSSANAKALEILDAITVP